MKKSDFVIKRNIPFWTTLSYDNGILFYAAANVSSIKNINGPSFLLIKS